MVPIAYILSIHIVFVVIEIVTFPRVSSFLLLIISFRFVHTARTWRECTDGPTDGWVCIPGIGIESSKATKTNTNTYANANALFRFAACKCKCYTTQCRTRTGTTTTRERERDGTGRRERMPLGFWDLASLLCIGWTQLHQ